MNKQMKKLFVLFLLLMVLALAGCLPQVQATPTSTATTQARPVPTVVLSVPAESLPDSGCTVVTKKPTPGPTAESIFPPIGDTDWVKGPANAKITIIEYSDFQ